MTAAIEALTARAMAYLEVGYPVHFAGAAGTGKTTLAFHVAARLGRPVILIHGDDEFGSSDLIGKNAGYRKSRTVDNFIHSVLRAEEEMQTLWVDNRLTTACQSGCTLVYDEFNRSRPEANNALLSILSERILNLPNRRFEGEGYLQVNSNFHAIFTSNPEEYAGTHKTQDALMDRLITIQLEHYDRETEISITRARSGIGQEARRDDRGYRPGPARARSGQAPAHDPLVHRDRARRGSPGFSRARRRSRFHRGLSGYSEQSGDGARHARRRADRVEPGARGDRRKFARRAAPANARADPTGRKDRKMPTASETDEGGPGHSDAFRRAEPPLAAPSRIHAHRLPGTGAVPAKQGAGERDGPGPAVGRAFPGNRGRTGLDPGHAGQG